MNKPNPDNDALRLRYNPDGSALRRTQLELLEILKVLDGICKEHNIEWWLSSGTLLGAARHQGFIPWDDDIDIVMLRKDFKRFDKIMRNYQSEEYVYHSMSTDVDYVYLFSKFRKRQGDAGEEHRRSKFYKYKGPFIDIFCIEKTNYFAARASSIIYNNLQHLTSYVRWSWLRRPLILLVNLLCLGIIVPLLRLVGLINPSGEYHYTISSLWSTPSHWVALSLRGLSSQCQRIWMPTYDRYMATGASYLPTSRYVRQYTALYISRRYTATQNSNSLTYDYRAGT